MNNPSALTFGELLGWYDQHHAHRVKSKTLRMSVGEHLAGDLAAVPLVDVTSARLDALLGEKSKTLAPETINHLRAFVHRLFSLATRADLWTRPNPVARVARVEVPKRPPA